MFKLFLLVILVQLRTKPKRGDFMTFIKLVYYLSYSIVSTSRAFKALPCFRGARTSVTRLMHAVIDRWAARVRKIKCGGVLWVLFSTNHAEPRIIIKILSYYEWFHAVLVELRPYSHSALQFITRRESQHPRTRRFGMFWEHVTWHS